jgi:signal transduction histidine kinase
VNKTKDSSLAQYVFVPADLPSINALEASLPVMDAMIKDLKKADTAQRSAILIEMDKKLAVMESQIKEIIDRHATNQRAAMASTRDSLRVSQTTSVVAASVLLLMGVALAFVFRRGVLSRLNQVVEADRLKSQLLTSISHELRTPINAIQGYSQLLVEEAYGTMTDEQKTTIRRIQLNTTQLNGMVNNLLDRAQLEQGKMNLRPAPFSPEDLINTTHSALNILATSKGLALTSEVEADVPPVIMGDVLRLQQILFNLTSNALKFTEKGSVHAHIFLSDEDHWALEVTDTGIGIAPEAQSQVFAPFWQVDSSATRQYRGSGLGLAIVKQLSDLMGGVITLKSQPDQGSTFTIVFPLEKTA